MNLWLSDTWSTGVVLIGQVFLEQDGVGEYFSLVSTENNRKADTFGKLCYMFYLTAVNAKVQHRTCNNWPVVSREMKEIHPMKRRELEVHFNISIYISVIHY